MQSENIDALLANPAVSDWLKSAIKALLQRDAIDAANDAKILAQIMDERARWALGKG